jgi:hypothetical protein
MTNVNVDTTVPIIEMIVVITTMASKTSSTIPKTPTEAPSLD